MYREPSERLIREKNNHSNRLSSLISDEFENYQAAMAVVESKAHFNSGEIDLARQVQTEASDGDSKYLQLLRKKN